MKRVLGIARGRAGRVGLVAGVLVAAVVGFAGPAGANTGHVQASQTCQGWSVTVTLDNNVTPDHFVEVTSTIPGTSGIVDAHYNTIGHSGTTQIWSASGATVTSGTVTLTILNANKTLDTTTNASLPSAGGCVTTTTQAPTTTTQAPTTTTCECNTTTTQAPTTTTTYPVTTTTEHHCDCATTTTQPETTTTQGHCECTTSTTQPATTTTQAATTTSTTEPQTTTTVTEQVLGSTTIVTTSTTQPKHHTPGTVQHEGSTIVVPTSAPASTTAAVLPHTGSNTTFPVIFGGICIALGSALALRKRSAWSRP